MAMFNNGHLPLNKMQKLQQRAARGVAARKHNDAEDLALAMAYQDGMEEAGLALFESYMDMVSFIYRYPHKAQYKKKAKLNIDWTPQDKEDLFQEIALHFFTLIGEFDPELGDFQAIIKGKLHLRVYDNFFEDAITVKFQETELDDSIDIESEAQSILIDESKTGKLPSEHLELYQALNQLTASQRQVVELSVVRGWNAPEIARELDMKADAVRKQLQRGMEKLKTIMIKEAV